LRHDPGRIPEVIYFTRSILNTNIQNFKPKKIYNYSEEKSDPESFNFETESQHSIDSNDKPKEEQGIDKSLLMN